jgi:hypothetical protein
VKWNIEKKSIARENRNLSFDELFTAPYTLSHADAYKYITRAISSQFKFN